MGNQKKTYYSSKLQQYNIALLERARSENVRLMSLVVDGRVEGLVMPIGTSPSSPLCGLWLILETVYENNVEKGSVIGQLVIPPHNDLKGSPFENRKYW